MRKNSWLLGACAVAATAALTTFSCSSDDFESCEEERTCPPPDAGLGGMAGAGSGGMAGAAGAAGDAGAAGAAGQGTVPEDTTPPTITSRSPDVDASEVSTRVAIEMTFSEPLDPTTINDETFVVATDVGQLLGTVDYDAERATFTPETPLPLNAAVTVTLSPEVTDLAGNPLADAPATWTFTSRDGVWSEPVLIETNSNNVIWVDVDVNSRGDAVVVWQQYDGTRTNIWANRFVPGAGWEGAQAIETDNAGPATYPAVAVDESGNAMAVWYQSNGTTPSVWANRFAVGLGWGTPEAIETRVPNPTSAPRLGVDAEGNVIAVWSQHDDRYAFNGESIWANRYQVGSGWGVADVIETSDANAVAPAIAMTSSGSAMVTWRQQDQMQDNSIEENIWSARYAPGVGWTTPVAVENESAEQATLPAVAVDGEGNAYVVWMQRDGTRYNVWSASSAPGNGWTGTGSIDAADASNSLSPHVAMNPKGDTIAVWARNSATVANIWAWRPDSDPEASAPQLVGSLEGGNAEGPRVALDVHGNGMAVWPQSSGTWTIQASRYTRASGWTTPQPLQAEEPGDAHNADVDVDAGGNAVAVWHESDGQRNNVWAARFADPGP